MRKLRNKINWILMPYFIFGLISPYLENICNIRFPDTSENSTFSDIMGTSWMFSIIFLVTLNIGIPIWRAGYKSGLPFPFKKTIEEVLNIDRRKKRIINIVCWTLIAIDITVKLVFKVEYDNCSPELSCLHTFCGLVPGWYQLGFTFFFPLIRGDYDKYLY